MTVEPIQLALFCGVIAIFISGILIGGFVEWNKAEGSQDLRRQLRDAHRETDELREYIWLVTTGTPTVQSLTPEGALPSQSVKVERSLHLTPVESSE